VAQGTSREAEATGRELARLPYSRSSFERVGHEVGTMFRRAQTRIEEVLIQQYEVPAEARSVSISMDRVALPMEEPFEAPPVPVDPPWVAAVMAARAAAAARGSADSRTAPMRISAVRRPEGCGSNTVTLP